MNASNHSLRVALVWNGTIYQEKVFSQTSEPIITMGDDDVNIFAIPAPGIPGSLEVFERQEKGYKLRFTDKVEISLNINDEEYDLEDLLDDNRAIKVGTVDTEDGKATLYEVDLHFGDWGILNLGKINIFFQLMEKADVVAGRTPKEMFDGALVVALLVALVVHIAFLIAAFIAPPKPDFDDIAYLDRFARFTVEDIEDAPDEEEDEIDDDEAADAVEEDEGEFGDPDEEVETVFEDIETDQVEEIDVTDLGALAVLDGALDSMLDSDDSLDPTMMDMVGDGEFEAGRGSGGAGIRGDGGGGGGTGPGSLGAVDGAGRGAGAGLGRAEEAQVQAQMTTGSVNTGDFCDPANIRHVVNSRANRIRHCFESQLQTNPTLSGNITVGWRVQLDGSASDASINESTMGNRDVENCIIRVVNRMRFEEPDGGICIISYPFVFTGIQ